MRINIQPVGLFIAGAGLGLVLIASQPAEAAILSWTLTFTSNSTIVGTGEFSYDDEKEVVVRLPFPPDSYIGDKGAPLRPDFVGPYNITRYANPVVGFTANLPGQNWGLGFPLWWDPEGPSLLGSFLCSRATCAIGSQWFAGSTSGLPPGQFAMTGGKALEDGSYTGSFVSAPIPDGPFTSGVWTAQAVPEPTTMAGTALFGAGYLLFKRRRSR